MIKVEFEGSEWGNVIPENCIFCKCIARHWHKLSNSPICLVCAEQHDLTDILNAKRPKETTIAPW